MDLQLDRPLVIFDIESTGVVPERDRIVELAVQKVMPDGSISSFVKRINPEMPIPPSSTAIHGISDADVADAPPFSVVASNLAKYLEGCDLGGYNVVHFDIPMLEAEFKRVGYPFSMEGRRVVDAYNIFCKLYPRTLGAAYKFFCGKEIENAHSADADTAATWEVLLGQLAKHPEIPRDIAELSSFCNNADPDAIDRTRRFKWRDGEVVVNFGKNNGRTLKDIAENDASFLRWIMRSDFPADVKEIASNALVGKFPTR